MVEGHCQSICYSYPVSPGWDCGEAGVSYHEAISEVAQSNVNKSVLRYGPTDLTTPNIVGPTMLGVVASVLTVVWKLMQQFPTKCNCMQQGVQTDGKCNIKQCWELLA